MWTKKNQEREAEHLETEEELKGYIVSRAKFESEFWQKALGLLELQSQNAEAEKRRIDAEIAKAYSEKAKADAEAQLASAQLAALGAQANAPPPAAEVTQLLQKLEQMDPCPSGCPWEDSPNEGGFRCTGGSHFKSYAEARAFTGK